MSFKYKGDAGIRTLLDCIDTLDVNPISDALKLAQKVSHENPGRISNEVDYAETAVNAAISKLIEARQHLTTATGRLLVGEDREERRNVPAAA